MGMIQPEALEEVYRQWVRPYIGSLLGKQGCVDGKTVCGASRMGEMNIHMLSVWVHEDGISMGQIRTEEKSNEITAIPALLSKLDIWGGLISIDAMGCQKAIAELIVERGAQYLLAVKGNQPTLHEEIREYFVWAQSDPIERKFLKTHVSVEKGHGRITKWRVHTCNAGWFEDKSEWPSLHTFVCVQRTCTRGENVSHESAYYISSLQADAADFGRYVRNHWSIENRLHWTLDVAFAEDASLLHDQYTAVNLSLLRKMALASIKLDSSRKASVNRKRKIAAIDDHFALSILSLV